MNDTDKATVVKEINKNINIIGLVLMNTIRPRADFIAALSQEVWGGKKVELEGMEQVTSATDVESRRAKITDTALQTRWNTEKDKLSQDKFKKKYKKTFVKGGRICANVKREFRRAEDLIKSTAKDSYLKEKINSLRII